ncbi:PREDICTED: neuronal acetylcholine receptor subunit alpha-7-like, partial [Acropora digitifera]|uniref:neuronal acetylcholine receptor subunit alpha-7-like n=1 Tax=Acropora digitifera TaxID=70779 RepID=UPI00077B1572
RWTKFLDLLLGDRILSVNGVSLERVTHEEAVSILKNITSEVELKVSQSTHNYSSFDLSNIPNASSANEELDNIEVKSLNSSDEHSTLDTEAHHNVERRSQGEQHPSPFAFPSEDEPVTMISKSIPPSLVNMTSSRSRNSEEVSLWKPSADLHEYSPSVEWELIGVPGEFHSVKYACCDQPFDDVTYNVQIKRRPLYYTMYLIIPCAMISILTLLVFLLPPDCNERMTVGMAILVTLSFFFIMVAENMPATSEAVPLVGMYYTVTMIEVSSAFFMTCWVLRFHHMNPTEGEVPKWVKVYLLGFGAKFFRFKFGNRTNSNEVQKENEKKQDDLSLTENNPPGRKGSVPQESYCGFMFTSTVRMVPVGDDIYHYIATQVLNDFFLLDPLFFKP